MHKLFLASSQRTSIYKKKEVIKYNTNFIMHYQNKFNLQEHREVSPFVPLEIKYTQQNVWHKAHVESKNKDLGKTTSFIESQTQVEHWHDMKWN